jgi:hypothetical protein
LGGGVDKKGLGSQEKEVVPSGIIVGQKYGVSEVLMEVGRGG